MASIKSTILSALCRLNSSKKIFSYDEEKLEDYIKNTQRKKEFTDPPKKLYEKCNISKEQLGQYYYYKVSPKTSITKNTILYIHGGGFFYGNHTESLVIYL